jgi:hypothetical protein
VGVDVLDDFDFLSCTVELSRLQTGESVLKLFRVERTAGGRQE